MSAVATGATSSSSPPRRLRPNPCVTRSGGARHKAPGALLLLLEGQLGGLPAVLFGAFALTAMGTGAFAALTHLAGPNAKGLLVVIWLIAGVALMAFVKDLLSLAAVSWTLLGAAALTVVAQLTRGEDSAIGALASVLGEAMLVGVVTLVLVALIRAWENRASARADRLAWALELVTLLAAGAAFASLLPVSVPVQAAALAAVAFLLAPQATALARGHERVGASADMNTEATLPSVRPVKDPVARTVPATDDAAGTAHRDDDTDAVRPAAPDRENTDDLLSELDSYPGLEAVKKQVRDLVAFLRVQQAREQQGMKRASATAHLRFEGGPGTGKTEMARLIARILASLGVVERGHLVEADRSKLVGKYQGHTADAVRELCDEAHGGVLFVDEAYALFGGQGDSFGAEAVNTLIKRMEDDRESFVVILAGYPREMAELMDSNPGLRSRVQRVIGFPDYSPDELLNIAKRFSSQGDYEWDADALAELRRTLASLHHERDAHWGNAREVRKLYEAATHAQAVRLAEKRATKSELRALTSSDVLAALTQYRAERDADRVGQRQAQPQFPPLR